MIKISVVMAVTLQNYPNGASNRREKFIRAVNSFIQQTYSNSELVIISDGCDMAEEVYIEHFSKYTNILFEKIEKAELFSGSVRNRGIAIASGDWICYLDSDDFFASNHLELLSNQITDDLDWCYSNDNVVTAYTSNENVTSWLRESWLAIGGVGTSTIIHKKNLNVSWPDGYGHDWGLVSELINLTNKFTKIEGKYYVCHIPGSVDL